MKLIPLIDRLHRWQPTKLSQSRIVFATLREKSLVHRVSRLEGAAHLHEPARAFRCCSRIQVIDLFDAAYVALRF